ncbi:MAG: helix-turn-helix domain-containing protein [archaeon]
MNTLRDIGLTENEDKIYLMLLKLGPCKVSKLSKETQIVRTSLYDILNSLIEKGIVTEHLENSIKIFTAAEPESLVEIYEEKLNRLKENIPKLDELKYSFKESYVESFKGKKGVLAILSDILKTGKDFLIYGNYTWSKKTFKHIPSQFALGRISKKINAKVLVDNATEPFRQRNDYRSLTELRYHPEMLKTKTITFIYDDKVSIFTQGNDIYGIIIKNKDISDMHKVMFEKYWKEAKTT